jgi:small-conductance mechanosensitive channel
MLAPLNLDLIQQSLGTRDGLLELAAILGCWKVFQANGIKIPFPQREVRLLRPDPAGTETGPVEGALQSNRPS